MEDEDREMAAAVARSEREYDRQRQQQSAVTSTEPPVEEGEGKEESIQKIMEAGFSREQAVQELQLCNGNVELALASLLAKSIRLWPHICSSVFIITLYLA